MSPPKVSKKVKKGAVSKVEHAGDDLETKAEVGLKQNASEDLTDAEKVPTCDAVTTVAEGIEGVRLTEKEHGPEPPLYEENKSELVDTPAMEGNESSEREGGNHLEKLLSEKLKIITSYMKLVSNKKNHPTLLQDNIVSGFLVLHLGDDDPEIVEKSFEVIHVLSKYPENLGALQKINYLMNALHCVVMNSKIKEEIRAEAKKLIKDLKSCKKTKTAQQPLAELSQSSQNVLSTNTCDGNVVDGKDNGVLQSQKPVDLNSTISTMKRKNKGQETILFIENDILQQKPDRTKVTQALIGVKGIISVTYDLKKSHCIIRGKRTIAPEVFGRAVASLNLSKVHLVRKNENKEEVLVHVPASDKENVQYPPYPEEYENENTADSSSAIDRNDKKHEDTSFFKSAKNFIQRSFYW